jgi:hypothetical protein
VAADAVQERGLAAAGLADDDEELTPPDIEIDGTEDRHPVERRHQSPDREHRRSLGAGLGSLARPLLTMRRQSHSSA